MDRAVIHIAREWKKLQPPSPTSAHSDQATSRSDVETSLPPGEVLNGGFVNESDNDEEAAPEPDTPRTTAKVSCLTRSRVNHSHRYTGSGHHHA